jgi:D-alanine-D-alanine ligase
MAKRKTRVAVIFGGRSSEHAISCVTAGSVLSAMDPERYDIVPIGIAADGRWVLTPADPELLAIADGRLPEVDAAAGATVALPSGGGALTVSEPGEVPRELGEVDVALPLLHGPYGEDGTIQGLFELAGIPYVGAGVFASAASMDKAHMKVAFAGAGLPMGAYIVVTDRAWRRERKRVIDDAAELGFPLFVKPARAGSSMGVSKAADAASLEAAVETAREHDRKVIIETAIAGQEVECGVLEGLDDAPPDASLPAGVGVPAGYDFYDFQAKYLDEGLSLTIPAAIPETSVAEIRRLAALAFEAVDCEGLARVDFFHTDDGRVLINEINTMPGFTPASAFPRMWAATGIDYPSLVDRLIQTALHKPRGLH